MGEEIEYGELEGESSSQVRLKEELDTAKRKLEQQETLIEESFIRTNALAMDAELVRIELNQIFNTFTDGMWVLDEQFIVRRVNDALCALLGKSKPEIIGGKCHDFFKGSLCCGDRDLCPMTMIMKGNKDVECDIRRESESEAKHFILTATPFRGLDGKKTGIVEGFKNITERERMEAALQKANEELQRLTLIDGLTQVANRRRFDECLKDEWARMKREQKPLSLIMCDIDWFKLYNDSYGHQGGDDCLCAVARTIASGVKRSSDQVARYGGEEFAVILPNTTGTNGVIVAEHIRRKVEGLRIAHAVSPVQQYVTLSLGVAGVIPNDDLSPQTLIEMADSALYEAKKLGRNCAVLKESEIP